MDPTILYRYLGEHKLVPLDKLQHCWQLYQTFLNSHLPIPFFEILLDREVLPAQYLPQLNLTLGPYRILQRLGRGATASVYKAQHQSQGHEVALKILHPQKTTDSNFRERFIREVDTALRLQHPGLVQGYDWGDEGGSVYFAMELLPGRSLKTLLETEGVLDEQRGLAFLQELMGPLEYLESQELVHRDIKPDNIVLLDDGRLKLCDLGLAKWTGDEVEQKTLTKAGAIVGTPYYVSPELIQGKKNIDIRSDFYSLGATFYRMIIGEPPFSGPNSAVVFNLHLVKPLVEYKEIKDKISRPVYYLLKKMMEKDPDQRAQTVAELIKDIARAQAGEVSGDSTITVRPIKKRKTEMTMESRRPNSTGIVLGTVAMLMVVAGLGWWLFYGPTSRVSKKPAPDKTKFSGDRDKPGMKKGGKKTPDKKNPPSLPDPYQGRSVPSTPLMRPAFPSSLRNQFLDFTTRQASRNTKSIGLKVKGQAIYKKSGECIRVTKRDTKLVITTVLPPHSQWPREIYLALVHLSSSIKQWGNSPISIAVNGKTSVPHFDPFSGHGTIYWARDWFPIRKHLVSGKNKIVVTYLNRDPKQTHYWLRRIVIEFSFPKIPGFQALGFGKFQCGKLKFTLRRYRHQASGLEFVRILGGWKVSDRRFLISQHEVTQGAWIKVMGRGTPEEKLWQKDPQVKQGDFYPAVYVSLERAKEFCRRTGLELPSGKQWRIAYAGGGKTRYFWGEQWEGKYSWNRENIGAKPHARPVGERPGNSFGLYDMAGNVAEWTRKGKAWGGSFRSQRPKEIFTGKFKREFPPHKRTNFLGFRVVKTLKPFGGRRGR